MKTPLRSIAIPRLMLWFCGALVLVAIAFVPLNSIGFVLPKIFFVALAGFVGTLAAQRDPERDALSTLLTTWTGRLLLLLVIITLLSPFWSIAPILSIVGSPPRFQGVLTHIAYFSVALTGVVAVQSEHARYAIVRSVIIANAIVVLYGVSQIVGLDPLAGAWNTDLFLGRVFSTIGQPTMLANFLLLTLPFVAWQARERGGNNRSLYVAIMFPNLAVLFATASRAALLGLLIAGILWVLSMPRQNTRQSSRRNILLIIAVALVLASIAAWSFSSRFRVSTQHPFSLGARSEIWKSAVSMIKERPSGYGLETVGLVSPRSLSPVLYEYESLTTKIDDMHSEPLQILLTLGWMGLLLTYGFFALLGIGLWRNRMMHPLLPVILISLTGTHVSLLAGVADPATSAFSWLIAGMGLGSLPSPAMGRHSIFSRRILWVAAIFSLLTAIIFGWWIVARFHRERSEALLRSGATLEAADAAMRTVVLFPYDRQILIETAEAALLALEQVQDAPTAARLHRIVGGSVEQLSALTSMQDGMAPLLLGWQATIRGNGERAAQLFTTAQEMRPVDVTVYRIAAHGYALLGDAVRERETEQALITLLPRDWNDPSSPRGRILRKEQPWLEPLLQNVLQPE
ncbi:MAG: O-antigen ligase family protein [Candidatus Peregrinibacteria bacterium]|nr:O-antigen ligase family protein [Candidatus Peregrinibacteria bacterium]